jgi:hypothetical protein
MHIGIAPGLRGALAVLTRDGMLEALHDTPTLASWPGGGVVAGVVWVATGGADGLPVDTVYVLTLWTLVPRRGGRSTLVTGFLVQGRLRQVLGV